MKEAIAHGADKVLLVDNEVYGHYSTDAYTAAIVHCVGGGLPHHHSDGWHPPWAVTWAPVWLAV